VASFRNVADDLGDAALDDRSDCNRCCLSREIAAEPDFPQLTAFRFPKAALGHGQKRDETVVSGAAATGSIRPTPVDKGRESTTSKLTFAGERAATDIRRSKRVPFQVSSSRTTPPTGIR
jgi:hypothetical protein